MLKHFEHSKYKYGDDKFYTKMFLCRNQSPNYTQIPRFTKGYTESSGKRKARRYTFTVKLLGSRPFLSLEIHFAF